MTQRPSHKPLRKARKLLISCLVCSVALFPLFGFYQVSARFVNKDPRKVMDFAPFQARAIDAAPPQLFEEPIISITFDDGRQSVYSNAMPLLNKYGIKATHYLLSGTLNDYDYVSRGQIESMAKEGQEIDCHSVDHPDLTTITQSMLQFELATCQADLSAIATIDDFASPYGHTNDAVIQSIKSVYRSHRNTNGDMINGVTSVDVNLKSNFNQYNLISAAIRKDTPVSQLEEAINFITKNNGWLILTYHQIEDNNNATFGLDPDSLINQLEYLSASNVKIMPVGTVLDTLVLQSAKEEY